MVERGHAAWCEALEQWAPTCSRCSRDLVHGWCGPCRRMHLDPQPGPQQTFLACPADIVLYGGAAGGGKTWAMLLDALRYAVSIAGWNGLVIRRLRTSMTNGGGIWAEAQKVFRGSGATFNHSELSVRWPNGSTLTFRQTKDNPGLFAGPSYDWIGIEELQEIDLDIMIQALTRLRSTQGIRPTLRATCNPKRGHGIVPWIAWYLHADGTPDRSKSGVVRWFCRSAANDRFYHGATPDEAEAAAGDPTGPAQSFAFVPSLLSDNPALDRADPTYRNRIAVQGRVRKAQLGDGNWYVGGEDDGPLARDNWEFVTSPISPIVKTIRAWDKAATRPTAGSDPDYTIGIKLGFDGAGRFYILDMVACREDTPLRDLLIARTAAADGHMCLQVHKQPGGDTGKSDPHYMRPLLAAGGAQSALVLERVAKEERARAVALALELGMRNGKPVTPENVNEPGTVEPRGFVLDDSGWLLREYRDAGSHPATIGELLWEHLDPFPNGEHDDVADALADAFNMGQAPAGRQRSPGERARLTAGRR